MESNIILFIAINTFLIVLVVYLFEDIDYSEKHIRENRNTEWYIKLAIICAGVQFFSFMFLNIFDPTDSDILCAKVSYEIDPKPDINNNNNNNNNNNTLSQIQTGVI